MKTAENQFFISCPLGFEQQLVSELERVWPLLLDQGARFQTGTFPEIQIEKGGVELSTSLLLGFQLNFFLKTAHRVVLRLGQFKASRYDILQKDAKSIRKSWDLQGMNFEFKVETHESRLNHKRNIEEALSEIFPTASEGRSQLLLVRILRDRVTLSLDTSGEHLHKRGWGIAKEKAPLRENLAHLLVEKVLSGVPAAGLKDLTLVDPFCGSGTLLMEGGSLHFPMVHREYAFEHFPFCPKLLKSPSYFDNYKVLRFGCIQRLVGCDFDPIETKASNANLHFLEKSLASKFPTFKEMGLKFEIHQEDSFQSVGLRKSLEDMMSQKRDFFFVSNLPYGERVEKPKDFEKNLLDFVHRFQPRRACFLGRNLFPLHWPMYDVLETQKVSQQGLPVELIVIQRKILNRPVGTET